MSTTITNRLTDELKVNYLTSITIVIIDPTDCNNLDVKIFDGTVVVISIKF